MRSTISLFALMLTCSSCGEPRPDDSSHVPAAASCNTTADCAYGTCLGSRCVADGSLAAGQHCELDEQCRSGACWDDTCEPVAGEPGGLCLEDGTCNPGSTCRSVFCVGDGSLAGGERCSEDVQCASGDCRSDSTCEYSSCDLEPAGGFSLTGSVDAGVPSDSVLVVTWEVTSGSPDYFWVFGDATNNGGSLSVVLASEPPSEAINSYGIAIGSVLALPTVVDEGNFTEWEAELYGATGEHKIIWKSACAQGLPWSDAFSPGYSCGECVPASAGEIFDTFAPTDCSNVEVSADGEDSWCNWT